MRKRIRPWTSAVASLAMVAALVPAGRAAEAITTKHLTVATSAADQPVAPGTRVSLVIDVSPRPTMHVYAPGQKDFIPVSLTLERGVAAAAGRAQFPAAEKLALKDLGETQLVYSKPFRIVQDVTIGKQATANRSGSRGATIVVKGTLKYQACDNSICYAPVSVPVAWTLAVQDAPAASGKTASR
jgi:hypothetical protein